MKRSEINAIMRSADEFIRQRGLFLPPFAYWTPEDWASKGKEALEITENQMGWDITDFGQGDFTHFGLFLFTVRNGHPDNWKNKTGKLYAEKLLIAEEGQVTPLHFHWNKMEDIINRGGADLAIQLYCSTPDESLDTSSPVTVKTDGVQRTVPAGGMLILKPGESITLEPYVYHKFWGEGGKVLIGEVSLVNDDHADNRFYQPVGRFPDIEEDVPPLYLLCNDYARYYQVK
jgi:D-lyxose ketol-isomerase